MAGKSSRFFEEGYKLPKYMLPLGLNSCVFNEAIKSFKKYFETDFFLFITRSDYDVRDFVEGKCKVLGIVNFEVVSLKQDTRGQADTVKIGLERANYKINEELYIFNIDSIRINFSKPSSSFLKNTDGYLEVFEDEGVHWSFIDPLPNNYVKRTTEKIKISNLCSNGLYYFSSAKLFHDVFHDFEKINDYKELFIAPMYNLLIKKNLQVKYILLEQYQTLFSGTPNEYEDLKKNQNI